MSNKDDFKVLYALSFAWQLGFFIIVPIGGFLALGYFGDKFFHSYPLLVILGLILGLASSIWGTYTLLIPLISKKKQSKKNA